MRILPRILRLPGLVIGVRAGQHYRSVYHRELRARDLNLLAPLEQSHCSKGTLENSPAFPSRGESVCKLPVPKGRVEFSRPFGLVSWCPNSRR